MHFTSCPKSAIQTFGMGYELRRATVDDLPRLKKLWEARSLPSSELEKRLTEFQIALAPTGELVAAVGLRLEAKQGLVYHETYSSDDDAGEIRTKLWERVHNVARNTGLFRLWHAEPPPVWENIGFGVPPEELKKKLPASFGTAARWGVLILREETQELINVEREFELFQMQQQQDSARAIRQAKFLKIFVWIFVVLFVFFIGKLLFDSIQDRAARGH